MLALEGGAPRVRLVIGAAGFVPWTRDVSPGDELGDCVLERMPFLRGRVLLPDEASALTFRVRLTSASAAPSDAAASTATLAPDGAFELRDGFGSGFASVELSGASWVGPPLPAFPAIRLGVARDGDVLELGVADLRDEIATTTLRVLGPEGVIHDRVALEDGCSDGRVLDEHGRTRGQRFAHARLGATAILRAPSLRPRSVTLSGGELDAVLAPPLWARFDVAGWRAERDRALRLVVLDADGAPAGRPMAIVDGTVRRSMEGPGRWQIGFVDTARPELGVGGVTAIQLADVDGFQRFSVAIPEAWRAQEASDG